MNILWDFDGTLFDTYPVYVSIFSKVVGNNTSDMEIHKHLKVLFSHAINHYKLTNDQLLELRDLENHLSLYEIKPFDGVEEGESLEDAIHREILEGTGVIVRLSGITGIYQNVTSGVTCVFSRGEYESGDLRPAENETS